MARKCVLRRVHSRKPPTILEQALPSVYTLQCLTVTCPSSTCDVAINSAKKSVAEWVIESGRNTSFTICLDEGTYNATDGTRLNFFYFSNVVLQKHPLAKGTVTIKCPNYTTNGIYNGIGFANSENITVCGLSFTGCGPRTSSLYFQRSRNVHIVHSAFHHNKNSGVGIYISRNFTIVNCTFSGSVGLQQDHPLLLIEHLLYRFGGAGLGISLRNIADSAITVKNCTFQNNIAYRRINNTLNDSRTYQYLPFGSGAAVYVRMQNVTRYSIKFVNCNFYNNTALHQGGAIALFVLDSRDNFIEFSHCSFIDNRAMGYFLLNQEYDALGGIETLDKFITETNENFSVNNFKDFVLNVRNVLTKLIIEAGGLAGSLQMALYGNSEFNKLCIKNSIFKRNLAFGAAGFGFSIQGTLYDVDNGLNSNQVWVDRCNFYENYALFGGSAFGLRSNARVDFANYPAKISNSNFRGNVNAQDYRSTLYRFGLNAAISTVRLSLSFVGNNVFTSNDGGCVNVDNAQVDIRGKLNFTNNYGTLFGSAMKISGLSLIQLFPNASINFDHNNASLLGGAVGVDNIRVEDDLALLLNYNCFLQYNIGSDDEQCPSQWNANISFSDNQATSQGDSIYAQDISRCTSTSCYSSKSDPNSITYSRSIFSLPNLFHYSATGNESAFRNFATAPSNLTIGKGSKPMHVFPGEQFDLRLRIHDQNNNSKPGVYMYPSNAHFTAVDITEIDLSDSETDKSFAGVSNNSRLQITTFVIRNSSKSFDYTLCFRKENYTVDEKQFALQLIDSSTGSVVSERKVMATFKCCHPTYEYNKTRGKCIFKQGIDRIILRGDNISTYFYIKAEKYGEFDENDDLKIGRIPSFYQRCASEAGLPGCLMKHDNYSHQCSEERYGFLCGKCPQQTSKNKTQGLAFNLLECVTCDASDAVLFTLICVFIVVASILIMYYNIGLSNSLRGFMYYAQMVGYVYVSGARSGTLDWDFYLSRVFGFSFYFPLCLAHMDALPVALFGFLPPILILMSIISYTILARKMKPLSNRKTLDGIWFLILIIYVYTFDTCFNLLRCVETNVIKIHSNSTVSGPLVYFYDGGVKCYQDAEHIPYAVISILTLVLFVIPFPFIVVAISWNYIKKAGPFCDVVNTGIKPVYNWWSGYDLFRRVLFVAVYYVFEYANGEYTRFALFFCAAGFLLITSRIQPYDKWRVNLVEWLMLLNLILITAYFANGTQPHAVDGSFFGTFLFVLPYIFSLIYLVLKCFKKTKFYETFRRRANTIAMTVSTSLGNSEMVLTVSGEPGDVITDNSYVDFRDELQVLTD